MGLGCTRFARHYSGYRVCFLFLRVLRCFSSPGSLPHPYEFRVGYPPKRMGCPIRKSTGHSLFTGSPSLIAGYHVLHRLLVPRHSPYAFPSLTINLKDHNLINGACRKAMDTKPMAQQENSNRYGRFAVKTAKTRIKLSENKCS
jgi:hypothetical protein